MPCPWLGRQAREGTETATVSRPTRLVNSWGATRRSSLELVAQNVASLLTIRLLLAAEPHVESMPDEFCTRWEDISSEEGMRRSAVR